MIDLRQTELAAWQEKNFEVGQDLTLKCVVGMAEELGEVSHHVLKGLQGIRGIRGGEWKGINREEVADGVADVLIYGIQLLSSLDLDAEVVIKEVIEKVLRRDWVANPSGEGIDEVIYCPDCGETQLRDNPHLGETWKRCCSCGREWDTKGVHAMSNRVRPADKCPACGCVSFYNKDIMAPGGRTCTDCKRNWNINVSQLRSE